MKHLNIRVSGLVQGVCFRYYTQEKAHELGIKGFVRNEKDGSVYIEAEGPEDLIDRFANWCQHGPTFARVDQIEKNLSTIKNYNDFRITY